MTLWLSTSCSEWFRTCALRTTYIRLLRNPFGVLTSLGHPSRAAERGATPDVLRGSGATRFYIAGENAPLLAWGGWRARTKALEYYSQEVAAQVLLTELSAVDCAWMKTLDAAADNLQSFFLRSAFLESPLWAFELAPRTSCQTASFSGPALGLKCGEVSDCVSSAACACFRRRSGSSARLWPL